MTESVYTPRSSRERMMEIMFESHDVPAYYTALQGVMSLYSKGTTTGTPIIEIEGRGGEKDQF